MRGFFYVMTTPGFFPGDFCSARFRMTCAEQNITGTKTKNNFGSNYKSCIFKIGRAHV